LGYVHGPIDNWEIAARLIGEGEMWESQMRSWEQTSNPWREASENGLVIMSRANRQYVARPKLVEFPEFAPAGPSDTLLVQHLDALLHMIPCHLQLNFIGSEHRYKVAMMRKLQERLAGFIKRNNKTSLAK
jgi:hypothetical protein